MRDRQVIPDAAVEAALEAVRAAMIEFGPDGHTDGDEQIARAALEAAAPHMMADRKPTPGEGDYAPSWDDRKKLAEVWQSRAPLPDEGLSERVYEALIEVAAWGYQQRLDEEL